MEKDVKLFVNNKKLATFRVNNWIGTYNKTEISELLEMSRPTLNRRLKDNQWKMKDIELIILKFPYSINNNI